jgi:RimJ/RimL family protein N-acetyltransferase
LKFKNRYFEIGKFISNQKYKNKGIMKKAFANFINYLNKYFKIRYIYAETFKSNIKNINFNLKNDFRVIKKQKKITLMRKKNF